MTRPLYGLAGCAGIVFACLAPRTADAQEDFRASDPDRPVLTEDAYPVKFREWEVELGTRGTVVEDGSGVSGSLELKTGLFLNGQLGIEVEGGVQEAVNQGGGGSSAGLETVALHLLYNFNQETWSVPAISARVDVLTPGTGNLGRQDWGAVLKGIATRSLGRVRLNGNVGIGVSGDDDGGDYWLFGVGFDYPIGLFSKAILGDVYAEVPADGDRARVWLEFGTRWQLTNLSVLDFGFATRLDEWERGAPNVELIVGLSRVFGIPGLVRVPPYPQPRLD